MGMPGRSGRQTVLVLPNTRSSVSLLLSGNNVCADEVDSVMDYCQGPGSPPSLLFPTLGMVSGYSYFIIFGKYPKEENKNIYLHTQRLLLLISAVVLPPPSLTHGVAVLGSLTLL